MKSIWPLFLALMLSDGVSSEHSSLEKVIASNHKLQDQFLELIEIEDKQPPVLTLVPNEVRLQRAVLKNARGHLFLSIREVGQWHCSSIEMVALNSLPKEAQNWFSIDTGEWDIVQSDVYRYQITFEELIVVRIVMYEYLVAEIRFQKTAS